jgi:hypothetical protein
MNIWPFKRKQHPVEKGWIDNYLEWANAQVCQGCGKKASDRKLDTDGKVISEVWVTEDWCGCKLAHGYADVRPTFGAPRRSQCP